MKSRRKLFFVNRVEQLAQLREAVEKIPDQVLIPKFGHPKSWKCYIHAADPPRAHGEGREVRHILSNCISQLVVHVRRIEVEDLGVGKAGKGHEGDEADRGAEGKKGTDAPAFGTNRGFIDLVKTSMDRFTCEVSRRAQDGVEIGMY